MYELGRYINVAITIQNSYTSWFLLFITNSWLSSFVIPEYKQLSEISYVYIININYSTNVKIENS